MIIGGQAVILYGEPRLTRDIDITLGIGREGLPVILSMCRDLSLKPIPAEVERFVEKTMVLPAADEANGIRVDFIFSFTPYEKEAIARSKKILLEGSLIHFAASEDVIIHKIFAHRPRDLEDVRIILLKNPGIDVDFVSRWISEFDSAKPEENLVGIWRELLRDVRQKS